MKTTKLAATPTPQSEALDSRQVKNNAGGYVYQLDDFKRLDRFLILGSDAQTYYQSARKLTKENADCVQRCLATDAKRTIARAVEISVAGRAPKNDPAIFVIALATLHTDQEVRRAAYAAVSQICRTGTHLFQFISSCNDLGKGWGRALKRAVANWYETRPADSTAYQIIKYRNRENFTQRDVLRLSHPKGCTAEHAALYNWACGKSFESHTNEKRKKTYTSPDITKLPAIIQAHERAMKAEKPSEILAILQEFPRLPWEALPTWCLSDKTVWEFLAPNAGITALIRNLGNMTRIGAIVPMSETERTVADRLSDQELLIQERLHPLTILQALVVYKRGHGVRSADNLWQPTRRIIDALDDAFYKAFKNVAPTGKRILLALDVSGSMVSPMSGSAVSCREATAALAMITARLEQNYHIVGFSRATGGHLLHELDISPKQRLDSVVNSITGLPFSGTDCSLPMQYATAEGMDFDAITIYTDSETWAGKIHPMKALQDYRKKVGHYVKLIVVGMTSTGFSIADPLDVGSLDVVGFDSSTPTLISDFIRED